MKPAMKSSTCFCRFVSAILLPETIVGEQKEKCKWDLNDQQSAGPVLAES
jgi:hypothetical protein